MPTRSGAQYSQNQRRSWPNMAQPQRHPSPLAAAAAAAAAPAPPQRATSLPPSATPTSISTALSLSLSSSSSSSTPTSPSPSPIAVRPPSLDPRSAPSSTASPPPSSSSDSPSPPSSPAPSDSYPRPPSQPRPSSSPCPVLLDSHRSPPIWLIYCVTLALIIASAILIISPSPFPTYDCAPQCAATAEPIVNSERFPLSDCGYGPSNFSFLAYPNPYFGLGFTQERLNVKEERIKKRHRKLVGLWHPDKVQVTGLSVWQHERISEWLNTMYNDLMDTEKRVRYHQGTYEWGSQLKEDPSAPRRPAWYKEEYDRPDEEEES